MTFDLRQLRAFEAVAKHGGFSRASREAGITQPTLSTHIRNLESQLGATLFDRTGRSVTLTPTGEVFSRYARRILEMCDQSIEAVRTFQGEIKGEVTIAASTVPGEYLLPRWLAEFHRTYPAVVVSLRVGDSAMVMDQVSSGQVPIGISGIPAAGPSLTSRLLARDEIILVVSGPLRRELGIGNRTSLQGLRSIPLIGRESGSGTRSTVESALRDAGANPDHLRWNATLGSTRAVMEGILAGIGAGFLSRLTVEKELRTGEIEEIKVNGLALDRGFFIVSHSSRSLSPVAAKLMESLQDWGGLSEPGDQEGA